ncbi:MAG: ribonuclease P protein component [Bacteroidales bacterium]
MSNGFAKSERISSRMQEENLVARGNVIFAYPFKVYFSSAELSAIIISVPKRRFHHAVDRNLIKRRVREAWRTETRQKLTSPSEILFVYVGKEIADYATIARKLGYIVEKISESR